jgi:sugar lactone lactonase YvrE
LLNGAVAAGGDVVSQGSVLRINLSNLMISIPTAGPFKIIASSFEERTDPAALVIGPTGVSLSADSTLFVADTLQNRIASIAGAVTTMNDAGSGVTVAQGGALKQPLGLALAPNGDILTVNAADGLIVETTRSGHQAGVHFFDASHSRNGAGTLFGLAVNPGGDGIYFVDDGNNTLNIAQ